jgi:hypothetical protein
MYSRRTTVNNTVYGKFTNRVDFRCSYHIGEKKTGNYGDDGIG